VALTTKLTAGVSGTKPEPPSMKDRCRGQSTQKPFVHSSKLCAKFYETKKGKTLLSGIYAMELFA
jgi:hypothetical protein